MSPRKYDIAKHRHRFAAWAAARGAQRRLKGGNVSTLVAALESSALPKLLRGAPSRWPKTSRAYDKAHRLWCKAIVTHLRRRGVNATFGRAAKIVAIYVKVVVVNVAPDSPLASVAHAPIDAYLLEALAQDHSFDPEHRRLWRSARWTQLNEADYYVLVESLRDEGLHEPAFWQIERYWVPA